SGAEDDHGPSDRAGGADHPGATHRRDAPRRRVRAAPGHAGALPSLLPRPRSPSGTLDPKPGPETRTRNPDPKPGPETRTQPGPETRT
ncbi:hypothetical protein T484DRAFT_3647313, partial [Baffinella frigidus]